MDEFAIQAAREEMEDMGMDEDSIDEPFVYDIPESQEAIDVARPEFEPSFARLVAVMREHGVETVGELPPEIVDKYQAEIEAIDRASAPRSARDHRDFKQEHWDSAKLRHPDLTQELEQLTEQIEPVTQEQPTVVNGSMQLYSYYRTAEQQREIARRSSRSSYHPPSPNPLSRPRIGLNWTSVMVLWVIAIILWAIIFITTGETVIDVIRSA